MSHISLFSENIWIKLFHDNKKPFRFRLYIAGEGLLPVRWKLVAVANSFKVIFRVIWDLHGFTRDPP